ncbi:MAG: hypothetical protein PHS49_07585 [Candidatus Gracilibacteria bacterium]|nr:hypothetical protein [Candidatus Gracilibacteria bacterium]
MKKTRMILNYIISIFNFKGKDTGLHFFIKSIISIIIGYVLAIIILGIYSLISYYLLSNDLLYDSLSFYLILSFTISLTIIFVLHIFLLGRRFRDIGYDNVSLPIVLYILISTFFPLGLLYWIYLCFAKSKKIS